MSTNVSRVEYDYHDNCERKFYVNWINRTLYSHELSSGYLPINPNSDEIFDQINDGVLYCLVLQYMFPTSIDLNALKRGPDVSNHEKMKNLSLAFETARAYGCRVVVLRVHDIFSGVRQSILELFWQIYSTALVNTINFENNEELIYVKELNEPEEVLFTIKPKDALVRYVNFRISKFHPNAPNLMAIDNKLTDGVIYTVLMDSIAIDKNIELPNSLQNVLNEPNENTRAKKLMENLDCLKCDSFISEELLKSFCTPNTIMKMHLLTLASIFNTFPILEPDGTLSSVQEYDKTEILMKPETYFERLCRNFMNFLGVKPLVCSVKYDCRNSLHMIQVMELLVKDIFKRDRLFIKFTAEQYESEKIHNACVMLNRFQKFYTYDIEELYPEYIAEGRSKVICGVIYNLMLYWVVNGYKDEEDPVENFNKKELIHWVNSQDEEFAITTFRDIIIDQLHILIKILDKLYSGCVDWEYFESLNTRLQRYIYFVSIARREHLPMFVHAENLSIGDHYSVMLAFAIMRYRTFTNRANDNCDEVN